MAQIQIWTRDVQGASVLGDKAPQHTFFIKINDDGTREVLRGGPDNDSMITGEITIVKQEYNGSKQSDGITRTLDWYNPNSGSNPLNYQGTTIRTSSQAEIDNLWNQAWNDAQIMNNQLYDYEALTQNCNTSVYLMSKSMGLAAEVELFIKQVDVWNPGYGNEFNHSIADRAYDIYTEVSKQVVGTIDSTIDSTIDTLNAWISNFRDTRSYTSTAVQTAFQQNYSYKIKPNDTLSQIALTNGYTLEELLAIPGNEHYADRQVGEFILIQPGETIKIPPRDNDADWVPPLMYQRNEAEQTIQFGDDGNPILNSPIDLYIQSITQSTQDPSLSGQEWLTGTQDYFLNWIEGYSDLTLDSFLTTTSDLLANNNDSNISNYYQNNSSNAYDDVFNGLLGNHKYSSSNSIQDAFNNLGIDYNLKLNDGSWWDSQYNGHLNQTTVNDTFFFNENTNFTLGFDNISGGYYGTGNNNNGLEDFSINLDYKAPINFFGNSQNHISPLTFDLDNDGIELSHAYDQNVYFDIDNDGFAEKVGWVNADDGQLAMDSNNNGNIDNITELYGDDQMPAFNKLGQHDSNNDGVINNQDTDFDKFLVWRDLNQNGISEEGELKTLTETGIKEISLAETKIADDDPIRWNNENFISATSRFTWDDAHGGNDGILADVHFLNDNVDTWYKGAQSEVFGSDISINLEAILLPLSRGYGSLPSLHIAMTENSDLKTMVRELVNLTKDQYGDIGQKIEDILLEWAGVKDNDPEARATGNGSNIDARIVDFMEQFSGVQWNQLAGVGLVGIGALLGVKKDPYIKSNYF